MEDDDLLSGAGTVLIQGVLDVTEAADTLSGAGLVLVSGVLTVTEASDTLAGAGTVLITGVLTVTEAGDTLEAFASALAVPEGANYIASLSDSGGQIANSVLKSVGWSVDGGWDWAADFNAGFDRYHAREKPYYIAIQDGLGNPPLCPPPMVATPREQTMDRSISNAGLGSVSGQDRASNRTRINNQSFPTFIASSTTAMIGAMAARSLVVINGAPDWWTGKEDIKQAKLADKLATILDLAGYDLVAALDGSLQCIPWETDVGTLTMPWSTLKGNYNPWEIWTGIRLGKFSSTGDGAEQTYDFNESGAHQLPLTTALFGPAVSDLSSVDGLGAVSFFGAGDEIREFYSFKPTLYQNPYPLTLGLATKMTVVVDPLFGSITADFPSPVRIRVTGTPEDALPLGIDREFIWPAVGSGNDTSLGEWPCPQEKIDSLWPSQSYAVSRAPYILAKINSQADTLTMTRDIIDTSPRLLQRFTWESKTYKVWAIKWNLEGDSTELTLVRV